MRKVIFLSALVLNFALYSNGFINRDEEFATSLDKKTEKKSDEKQIPCKYITDPNLYEIGMIKLIKANKLNGKVYCNNSGVNMVYTTGNRDSSMQIGLVYKYPKGNNSKDLNSIITQFNKDLPKLMPNNIDIRDSLLMPRYYHYRVYFDFGDYKFMFFNIVLDTKTNDWTYYVNEEVSATPEIYNNLLEGEYFSTTDVIY